MIFPLPARIGGRGRGSAGRGRRSALLLLWVALSVNAGLEDPSCPHHAGPGSHAAAGHGESTSHGDPAGHAGHHGDPSDAGCACLGVCVPAALGAAAAPGVRVPVAWIRPATTAALDVVREPLRAPVAYLLPFATAPPVSLSA